MASNAAKLAFGSLFVVACGHADPRVFALKAPVVRDQDLDLVTIPCKPKEPCGPQLYESSFAWDAADNTVFRPISEGLTLKPEGPARNVNAFDEVADSAWFTNRIGQRPMTPEQAAEGYCVAGKSLNPDLPDGSWLIDHGKDNGANPGFRVSSEGTKYMLKIDDPNAERATGATSMATRFYYAAGWWAPCDSVVYFKKSLLKLKPGLQIKANVGPAKKFDEKLLEQMLKGASRRGELYRVAASRWLPGKPLGPFTYEGKRKDDPSDTVPHEHRRDLRGARVMAAWLNHFDAREQNSMETWLGDEDLAKERADTEAGERQKQAKASGDNKPKDEKKDDKKDEKKDEKKEQPAAMHGHIRRWYIDLGDCFGSEWDVDGFSRRHGHAYLLDWGYLGSDFITFGAIERPWERNERRFPFGYFSAKDFDGDAEYWKNEYPNPAFSNLDEGDGAWMTRIIARFTKEHVAAIVDVGQWTSKRDREWLLNVLLDRQKAILHRYFSKLSPVTDVVVDKDKVCATDLARKTETWPDGAFTYRAAVRHGLKEQADGLAVTKEADGKVCVPLASTKPAGGIPDDAPERYTVVRMTNGVAPGPLEMHFYDLGPEKGLQLVGILRPAK